MEEERIRPALDGDKDAFGELVTVYQGQVSRICLSFLKNESDAEDAAQETFVKVWQNRQSFREEAKFTTWLYRIAVNTCKDLLRIKKAPPLTLGTEEGEVDPADGETTEETVLRRERIRTVTAALNTLPDKDRTLILLREASGYSYEEIAAMQDLPEGTVKSRLNRARHKLQNALKDKL